ncbi:uncharacterized protein [Haliotis asinina]|uniref:uncharacterized protein n=1 Tax=Haliotis asinina TaxID=109174 RepID=UPI003531829F
MFLLISMCLLLLLAMTPAHATAAPGNQPAPCLTGEACRHTYSRSYMNDQVFCCPNGQGMSVYSNGFSTHCTCGSNSFVSNVVYRNGQRMSREIRQSMRRFQAEMSAFNRQMSQLGQNLANMFRGGFW